MSWKQSDTLTCRARQNAYDAMWSAVAVLVDVEAGAFIGSEVMADIDRALECLNRAKRLTEERWAEFLASQHGKAA